MPAFPEFEEADDKWLASFSTEGIEQERSHEIDRMANEILAQFPELENEVDRIISGSVDDVAVFNEIYSLHDSLTSETEYEENTEEEKTLQAPAIALQTIFYGGNVTPDYVTPWLGSGIKTKLDFPDNPETYNLHLFYLARKVESFGDWMSNHRKAVLFTCGAGLFALGMCVLTKDESGTTDYAAGTVLVFGGYAAVMKTAED